MHIGIDPRKQSYQCRLQCSGVARLPVRWGHWASSLLPDSVPILARRGTKRNRMMSCASIVAQGRVDGWPASSWGGVRRTGDNS
jgi:hypothetical protein